MLMWDTVVLVGLLLIAAGAAIAAFGVVISTRTAAQLGGTDWDQNLVLKRALLKQSRTVAVGLALITMGALLQMAPIVWAITQYS